MKLLTSSTRYEQFIHIVMHTSNIQEMEEFFKKKKLPNLSIKPWYIAPVYRPRHNEHIPIGRCPNCKNLLFGNRSHACAVIVGRPVHASEMGKSEDESVPEVQQSLFEGT
jgi:hypothetical protein